MSTEYSTLSLYSALENLLLGKGIREETMRVPEKDEMPICNICKDPIWSFICTDCLAEDIYRWLPGEVSAEFREFNRSFMWHFRDNEELPGASCMHCKDVKEAVVCPFCYIAEASLWLEKIDKELAENLARMLPRYPGWEVLENGSLTRNDGINTIKTTKKPATDEGVCELCMGYSERLRHHDGNWVCEWCY